MSWMHEFVSKYGEPFVPTQFVPHRHYGVILDNISQKLQEFQCSWEMVNAVHTSLVGEWTNCLRFGSVTLRTSVWSDLELSSAKAVLLSFV